MALVLKDRVKETSTTTGTGTITLAGAATGFQSFSAVGNGNTTYYTIAGQTGGEWEVGIGTYTAAGTTLSRDTVLASSNSGSLVVFSAGTKDVFVTYPASYSVATQFANTFTANQVISDNSANAALRITQVGAGNALLVEDSANPDNSPVAIDQSGTVILGDTISRTIANVTTSRLQISSESSNGYQAGLSAISWDADTSSSVLSAPVLSMSRSASDTTGTNTAVIANNALGSISFQGADGTTFIRGASISAFVDGTPGTNDMPGRLVLSTTKDGASSPTEAVRIDNQQQVGIGGAAASGVTLYIGKNATGSTSTRGVGVFSAIQSDSTASFQSYRSSISTAASAFTLAELSHFAANQNTIGAGSAVTTQYGFNVASTLTGATNNYGFYGNLASATGVWNFYAAGTAANYFAGDLRIGTTTNTNSSKIVAAGVIESTTGGVRFPDGTTQTSAGISTGKSIAMSIVFGG